MILAGTIIAKTRFVKFLINIYTEVFYFPADQCFVRIKFAAFNIRFKYEVIPIE